MKAKQIGYVLIALIVIGFAGIVVRLLATETTVPVLEGINFLSEDVIDKIVMRDLDSEAILVKREDGEWWVGPYPVLQIRLRDLWDTVSDFEGAELVATKSTYHRWMGVAPENSTFVQFLRGDETVETFFIGDKAYQPVDVEERIYQPWNSGSRRCFVRPPEADETYGVPCDFPDRFITDPRLWADPIVVRVPRDEVDILSFRYPDDRFDVAYVQSVWLLGDEGEQEKANTDSVQALLGELEYLVTRDFPSEQEANELDFGKPNVTLGITTKRGASQRSTVLLFVERPEGGYFVKDINKTWIHVLDDETAALVLRTRQQLLSPLPEGESQENSAVAPALPPTSSPAQTTVATQTAAAILSR